MTTFSESEGEQAAFEWLERLGWGVAHAPDAPNAERSDYGQVVLERRLRYALADLNPKLSTDALEDTCRKLTRPEGSSIEAHNRAFYRMLVKRRHPSNVRYGTAGSIHDEPGR